MKIGIILGTRPEIIKMSSIVRYCKKSEVEFFILHTNQHYSENMDKIFFDELDLPQPKYNLGIGSGSHGEMTGNMMIEMEKVFQEEEPDVILVQGDTNTVMAGALVASKMDIKVGHVEAGLRSYDRTMPEETNRIVTDHISDYLFTPTEKQSDILMNEGIDEAKIYTTGNTVVDAVQECKMIARKKSTIRKEYSLDGNDYILVTTHRPATVDNEVNLTTVIRAIKKIASNHEKRVILPLHPRTAKMIEQFKIDIPSSFSIIEPIGYLDMLTLQENAFLIVTDSGGLQEESCILEKKCAVIRENTERPEAVDVGGCILVGNSDCDKIVLNVDILLKKDVRWSNPFGDGLSGQNIIKRILGEK